MQVLIAVLLLSNAFGKNLLSDPKLKSDVNDREINEEEELEIVIEDSVIHSYTITNDNYFYCFSSDTENIFYKNTILTFIIFFLIFLFLVKNSSLVCEAELLPDFIDLLLLLYHSDKDPVL